MTNALPGMRERGLGAIYRRLARNSAYLAGGTAASALFMMLAAVLNARALSAREFGLLVLFQSATMMTATIMSFSTQQPVIKLGSTALADGDLAGLGRIIGLGLLLDLCAASLAAIIAFAFLAFGRDWIGLQDNQVGIAALFAASLFFTGYVTSNGIFRLLDRFGLLSLIQAGCAAMILAATAYLYLSNAPFELYCWAWAAFYAVNAQLPLLAGLWLARRAGIPITLSMGKMAPGETGTFLSYCWTTWGTATAEALRSNGDSLLVGAVVSVEGAGIYNVAKQLAGVLRKINTVMPPLPSQRFRRSPLMGKMTMPCALGIRMIWVGGAVGLIAVVGAILLGRPVLGLLFGERFEPAWMPLVILTAAAAAQLVSHTLSMYVQVYVGPESLFRAYLLAIGLFLVAVFPLTYAFSTAGTAFSQLVFSLALIFLCHWRLRRANAA